MKKIFQALTLLAITLVMALTACSGDELKVGKNNEKGNTVYFSIPVADGPRTYGPTGTTPLQLERETTITSLYAVVFDKNSGVFKSVEECQINGALTTDGSGKTSIPYKFTLNNSGEYVFYLVANPDNDFKTKIEACTQKNDLATIITSQDPGNGNQATNFIMTSGENSVTLNGTPVTLQEIEMIRLSAKIHIIAGANLEKLDLTKVTLKNRVTKSAFATPATLPTEISGSYTDKVYEKSASQTIGTTPATGSEWENNGIYTYEQPTASMVSLVIEGTYNGKSFDPLTVNLPAILRNHLYRVILTDGDEAGDNENPSPVPNPEKGKLKAKIEVVDWNIGGLFIVSNNELIEKTSMPDFTITEKNTLTITGGTKNSNIVTNPTKVEFVNSSQVVLDLTTYSIGAGTKIIPQESEAPMPTAGTVSLSDNKLKQTYTITFPAVKSKKIYHYNIVNQNNQNNKRVLEVVCKSAGSGLESTNIMGKAVLSWVAEFNIGTEDKEDKTGKKFCTNFDQGPNENKDVQGLYRWSNEYDHMNNNNGTDMQGNIYTQMVGVNQSNLSYVDADNENNTFWNAFNVIPVTDEAGHKLHLPSDYEWIAILGDYTRSWSGGGEYNNVRERVQFPQTFDKNQYKKQIDDAIWNSVTKEYTADYSEGLNMGNTTQALVRGSGAAQLTIPQGYGRKVIYALRFKEDANKADGQYSAWRYELFTENSNNSSKCYFVVSQLMLDSDIEMSLNKLKKNHGKWFDDNASLVVTRVFPACGNRYSNDGSLHHRGDNCFFWCSSRNGVGYSRSDDFDPSIFSHNGHQSWRFAVRPFFNP